MFVDDYHEEYFDSIVKLEKRIYPQELCLGPELLQEELKKEWNFSKMVFSNGELLGYIISHYVEKEEFDFLSSCEKGQNKIYISDLNCVNKKALWHLIACYFGSLYGKVIFYAECRERSFQLLANRKYGKSITLLNVEKMLDYYSKDEHAMKVSFCFDPSMVNDWRIKFTHRINQYDNMCGLSDFSELAEDEKLDDEEIKKSTAFVLKTVNERNLNLYRMLGNEVAVITNRTKEFYNESAINNYVKKLKEAGFRENQNNNIIAPNEFRVCDSTISYCRKLSYDNSGPYNDLSTARYLFGRIRKQRKPGDITLLYDRYGVERGSLLKLPYCNRRTWEYEIKYLFERRNMRRKAFGTEKPDGYLENLPDRHFRDLGRLVGFKDAALIIHNIIDHQKVDNSRDVNVNYIHDWNIIIGNLIQRKRLLTKGAVIACLNSSYNAAIKISDYVSSIGITVDSLLEGRRKYSQKMLSMVKEIRKELSRRIRNGQELESLLKEISKEADELNERKYNLTKNEKKAISAYIERMNRYIEHIDTTIMIKTLGKTFVKKMLAGNCKGLFTPRSYSLSTTHFCSKIIELLKTSSRQTKHLYSDLKKARCLKPVFDYILTKEQQTAIESILKYRNCSVDQDLRFMQQFVAKVEPKCSPEFLVAGNASVCCMSFGAHNAIQYAKEEGIGVLNIYFKDRIIANSVLWIDDNFDCLVLDNIEVHPNYIKLNEHIRQLYMAVITELMKEYQVKSVVQGVKYNDLKLYSDADNRITIKERKARDVENQYFYSDAYNAFIIKGELNDVETQEHTVGMAA